MNFIKKKFDLYYLCISFIFYIEGIIFNAEELIYIWVQ
mgnify:FL=1